MYMPLVHPYLPLVQEGPSGHCQPNAVSFPMPGQRQAIALWVLANQAGSLLVPKGTS